MTPTRWILTVVAALLVVGLVVWAHGRIHHRGNEVGSSAGSIVSILRV